MDFDLDFVWTDIQPYAESISFGVFDYLSKGHHIISIA